jgi:ribonuclease III
MIAPSDGHTALETALGVEFRDRALLDLALTHRSYAFEAGGTPHNERLELLGDAVLGLVVTERIYRDLPDASEGRLAKIRAAAVNTASLAGVARGLGIGNAVKLGRGEEQSGGRDKDSILADTLEAIIGALYVDQGVRVAAQLVERLFAALLAEIASRRESLDYKTSLQELTAAHLAQLPVYGIDDEGPDHDKRFTAVVSVAGERLGTGRGRTKKEAEQGAARQACAVLRKRFPVGPAPEAVDNPSVVGPADGGSTV